MNAVITILTTVLGLLAQIVPGLANPAVQQIIDALVALLPVLIQEYVALVPMVKNVIAALQSNANITPDQLSALQQLDAQCDAAFDAAANAAAAADGTPPATPAP
jgi:hypothetical protein